MTDLPPVVAPVAAPDPKPPAAETNGQLIVALLIVVMLGILGTFMVIAGAITHEWPVLTGGIGTIIGILGTALNTPTGIGNVLRASKAKDQTP